MGRNKGDAARSKFRASSSSVAASLLKTPVTSAVGFGGFVGSSRVDLPPASDGEHLVDVDGDALLHLKRLSKKDPTTKLTALTALTVLFEERSAAEVSALLPPWVFEYKRLVQDSSRQVRQSAHVAMASLATCVGRGLAPQLRSLMGPWWVAQFDPSREVAEAAKISFQVAFSGQKKRLEALMFCESEIFTHINENLSLTPQTISDKATPIEESMEKHERVVSCSLLALAALIDVLVESVTSSQESAGNAFDGEAALKTKDPTREEATKLCRNHKFLQQFLKSKSSRIRAATYQALRSFIHHIPDVFREEDMDVVVPSILGIFPEKDPACHQPMWDMVLLFSKGFPQVWGTAIVRKAVIPRLWGFLRQGCYGSPQISYPYLLPLISLIPPNAVIPAQSFLLDFFSNLWRGHTAPQVGPEDRVALLKALQECLVWTVFNAKRFCDVEGYEAVQLQLALIDGVLVQLLWRTYIVGYPSSEISLAAPALDSSPLPDFSGPALVTKASGFNLTGASSNQFTQELGSCIVQVIHILSGHGDKILGAFLDEFQGICFQIVQEAGIHWQSSKEEDLRFTRVAEFFSLLGSRTSNGKNWEQWSLIHAVRPFVAKSFPAIRSLGHPDSIRLIAKLTSIYGPTVFSLLSISENVKDPPKWRQVQDLQDDEDIVQYFRKDLGPWCLDGNDDLNAPKAELVLAFTENHRFQGEWDFVIAHITGWQEGTDLSFDIKQVGVLATILEKITERRDSPSRSDDKTPKRNVSSVDWWKSPRIDGAAVKVASCDHLSHPACLRLLRCALGGVNSEWTVLPVVSDRAAVQILEIILWRILGVMSASATKWVRSAPSVVMDFGASDSITIPEQAEITEENLQLAVSSLNILGNSIFSLLPLDRDNTVGGKLLAAIFCLKWAYSKSYASAFDDAYDSGEEYHTDVDSEEGIGSHADFQFEVFNELQMINNISATSGILAEEPSSELEQVWNVLRESLLSVWHKISPMVSRRFSALTRFRLRQVLVKCLRLAVLDEEFEAPQQMGGRCAAWAQEVAGYACESPYEVSEFVDVLLASEKDSWPLWVGVPSPGNKQTDRDLPSWKVQQTMSEMKKQKHGRFATFVDHLFRTLSPQEIFLRSPIQPGTEMDRKDNVLENWTEQETKASHETCRIWLVVELLCTWEWPGGSALHYVLSFMWSLARSHKGSSGQSLLWGTIRGLFIGSSNSVASTRRNFVATSGVLDDYSISTEEPFLRALLILLKGLLEKEDGWSKVDARVLFRQYVIRQEAEDFVSAICDVQILPHLLSVLMPILRKRGIESAGASGDEEWQSFLQTVVSVWLQKALIEPPLVIFNTGSEISGNQWIQVAVACFPLNSAGGAAAMASASSAPVTSQERELLLGLLRKQFSREAIAAVAAFAAVERISHNKISAKLEKFQPEEVTLAKLVAVAIGYCWPEFGAEEWEFILKRLRGWLQESVIEAEEFAEAVVDVVKQSLEDVESKDADSSLQALENVVSEKRNSSVELSSTAVAIFSLLRGLSNVEEVGSTDVMRSMNTANWEIVEMRALEDILRILLAAGLAESAAASSSAGENGANVIALQWKLQSELWDNVAEVALGASSQAREAAIRAVDLWGVGKGAISSLYALLFSPQPTASLQWVAYQFLSTHQVLHMAVTYGIVVSGGTESKVDDGSIDEGEVKLEDMKRGDSHDMPPAHVAQIRPELASILETTHPHILQSPLTSSLRVSYLLGWSLLLTRLQSLTASSSTRERLVQYIQDADISPTLLDCLFQHIPLEQNLGTSGSRRRNLSAGVKAAPATRAAATGSVAFAVEGLWPVQREGLVTMAGAIYGLMLLVLPACVRIWFTGLRDKSLASAIEAFTTTHCSPQLLSDEFAQVQASAVDEENLSIRPNRSLREVTAIYKKEEAGMDIVIRIPSCYPLRAVDVECTRRMGINKTLLRKWLLSMASFLRNQNGAVAEAVQMWKKNVDRAFEGVEECPICYSIIHTSNHNLPRLACKTCRHKFHSACLYKWFSTSHQSTCPLCKTPF